LGKKKKGGKGLRTANRESGEGEGGRGSIPNKIRNIRKGKEKKREIRKNYFQIFVNLGLKGNRGGTKGSNLLLSLIGKEGGGERNNVLHFVGGWKEER